LLNVTPRESLGWRTPFELVHGKKPDISNLVPFYSMGICYISKEEKAHQLEANGQECRMLGYDSAGKNVYVVFNCESGKIERRENVRFDEGIDFERKEGETLGVHPRFKFSVLENEGGKIQDEEEFFDDIDNYWNDSLWAVYGDVVETVEKQKENSTIKHIVELPPCPKNVRQAIQGNDWEIWSKAIYDELDQIVSKETLFEVDVPKGTRIAKMKIVLQVVYDNNFQIKYKARLVVCGYSQVYGIDYKETYSPTISRDSLMIVLYLALHMGFIIEVVDVKGAFLEGKNRHDVYVEIPREILPKNSERIIVKIINSLYGEKQAAYEWFQRLKEILCDYLGFEKLVNDECIFIKKFEGELVMMLTIHVDDIIVAAKEKQFIEDFKNEFRNILT
jgi:hypothetical protein